MPVPRRFDRQPPERDQTRINERIRVPEVRLIDEEGKQVGVMKTHQALRYAQDKDLDLVEVAPDARPPVCRVLDYSKYKYEQAQKQKAARKHQQQITVREIKFRPKIAQHDYDTKKGHVERFLKHRDKVKVTIMFRGREVAHPERGEMILNRLAEELQELAVIEQRPQQDGRNMTMMLAPSRTAGEGDGAPAPEPSGGSGPVERQRRSDKAKAEKRAAREPAAPEPDPAAALGTLDSPDPDPDPAAAEPKDAAQDAKDATEAKEAKEAAPKQPADKPAPAAKSSSRPKSASGGRSSSSQPTAS